MQKDITHRPRGLLVPSLDEPGPARVIGLDEVETEGADRVTVLVVDDHSDLRAYVKRRLAARYRVIEAADGAEGLKRARAEQPDVVVSDVMMPGLDGLGLLRALRADVETESLAVILLTARADADARLAGLAAGADDCLSKPFDVRELQLRLENLLDSRRRLRRTGAATAGGEAGRPGPAHPSPEAPAGPGEDRGLAARATAVIDRHLDDESFGVDALAAQLSVSRAQLYRRLRAATGRSPGQLLLERRLEEGARLLAAGAGSVSEVAYGVGFKSLSFFVDRFRDHFGSSPAAWKRQKRHIA